MVAAIRSVLDGRRLAGHKLAWHAIHAPKKQLAYNCSPRPQKRLLGTIHLHRIAIGVNEVAVVAEGDDDEAVGEGHLGAREVLRKNNGG
jgi:hypothetical protein